MYNVWDWRTSLIISLVALGIIAIITIYITKHPYTIYEPTINRAKSIGKGTKIGAFVDIGKDVVIGENCNIQSSVTIGNGVRIGNFVFIAPHCSLLNDKNMDGVIEPCIIEDYVRIGGASVILPRVILRKNTVVGAGSVVVESFPEGSLIYGNPAMLSMRKPFAEKLG